MHTLPKNTQSPTKFKTVSRTSKTLDAVNGKQRIMIENVMPQVDHGLYPAKRSVGERVDVSAHIFTDGHDHVRAQVLYKHHLDAAENWHIVELVNAGNDEWHAAFYVTEKGTYTFAVRGWVDHFDTWYDGFCKKANAKVEVHTELLEGAQFLRQVADAKEQSLFHMADRFEDEQFYGENIATILSEEFRTLVHTHPLIEHETYAGEYRVSVAAARANFSTWYELFPRSAALEGNRHGTFQDVIKLLPRIASMGFDVLYLPPIHPIGKANRKGKNNNVKAEPGEPGSPWAIGSDEGGHKSIHPELGTLADYKDLIREAAGHGIDIAMDVAFQCAPDHPYVSAHPEWFKQRPDGTIQYAENPPKKYQDIYPFNFECDAWQALWEELRSVFFYWIEQGVKIFRVDNPHTKPIRFWQWVIAEINQHHEDIIFLSEAFTRPKIMASLAKVGFTQSYTYFTWRVTKEELTEYVEELVNSPSRNYFRPNFWPNTPDILPYHLQHQPENIFIIRLALAATLSSNYGMYGPAYEFGEHTPVAGKEEYFNSEKYEIRPYGEAWKKTNRMTDLITILNRLRKAHPALQSTWNIQFLPIQNDHMIAYLKASDDLSDIILVVVNLDPHNFQSGYVELPRTTLGLTGNINVKLHDLVKGEQYTWTQDWNYVGLDPFVIPFHLFKLTVHESNW